MTFDIIVNRKGGKKEFIQLLWQNYDILFVLHHLALSILLFYNIHICVSSDAFDNLLHYHNRKWCLFELNVKWQLAEMVNSLSWPY